jgi:hypothetical protein
MVTVPHDHLLTRRSGQLVASGALDLVLAALLYAAWLALDHIVLLIVATSTLVAGLVSLAVGFPRLRRERAARLIAARGPRHPEHVGQDR